EAFAPGERFDRSASEDLGRRPHGERVVAFEREATRPADAHDHRGVAGSRRRQRYRDGAALLAVEPQALRRSVGDGADALVPHLEAVVAGLAFDVVELEMHGSAIAIEEKSRQRG